MTIHYKSRPHSQPGVSSEYQRASRDWLIWQHLGFMLAFVAVLVLAVWLARIGA